MKTFCVIGMMVVLAIIVMQSHTGKSCVTAVCDTAEAVIVRMEMRAIAEHMKRITNENHAENEAWNRHIGYVEK